MPLQAPDLAIEEIERLAGDHRFVSILVLAQGETLLGRRQYWPIYKVAEQHKLPLAIHAGSQYRMAPSSIGWPSYRFEYYIAEAQAFQAQLLSLILEGVFGKFPGLKVVLMESGVSWLPAFMWRANKTWKGVRVEVPWVDRPPADIMRDHVRLTAQPFDSPPDQAGVEQLIDQIGSDKHAAVRDRLSALAVRRRGADAAAHCRSLDCQAHVRRKSARNLSPPASESLKETEMTDVLDRTDERAARKKDGRSRLKIIDCDIHPALHSRDDLNAFLPKRWQEHLKTYGPHIRKPFTSTTPYPRSAPLISRRDAWPPTGGPPGSDLAFMQQAASRSVRRRVRPAAGARPRHTLAGESRVRRGPAARHQRVAGRVLLASPIRA